ncbi:MAG: hypothetical protein ACRETK_13805 [Steroidobacteraceae bacterium]
MSSAIAAIIAAWVVSVFYRRQQRKPAAPLSDGTGHVLTHGRWERVIAWLVLGAAVVPACIGFYVLWRPTAIRAPHDTVTVMLGGSAVFAGLSYWCFRSARRRIRVNDSSVTLYGGRSAIEIAWASVSRVTTDLTGALLICSSTGSQITVNKLLVGIPTLVAYMRRHLPESMYSGAFMHYTPRAHLDPI